MSRLPTASKVERALACPASEALPHEEQPQSEAAEAGNGRHEALIALRDGKDVDASHADWVDGLVEANILEDLQGYRAEVALAYDVAFSDARELGERLGRQYPETRPTEVVGSADYLRVRHIDGGKTAVVQVVDLKTGRHEVRAKDNAQLLTLALAAARAHKAKHVEVAILWAPEGQAPRWDWEVLTPQRLERHAAELADMMARIEEARAVVESGRAPEVMDGNHCHFCPAKASCPKRSALAVQATTAPTFRQSWTAAAASGQTAHVWQMMKVLRGEADEMERVLRSMARTAPVDIGDGRSLVLRNVERESIDAGTAWPVLVGLLGEDAARAAVVLEMSKASVERGVKAAKAAGALKGAIKAGVEQVMEAVRQSGAVTTKTSERFEEK